MVNGDILEEYREVISRSKFHFSETDIIETMKLFTLTGEHYTPECLRKEFIDLNDVIFYETYLMKAGAYLITGNLKHFPSEPRILSTSDIVKIIKLSENLRNDILCEPTTEYISDIKRAQLQRAWEAMERMRASAVANGIADMPMEEIDEEIKLVRQSKHIVIK
ncbi:MAG: hypothetical protein IJ005_08305 [Bacteroidales bacterium]|nr:hypothetical protein [Bacteroidales bacterium]